MRVPTYESLQVMPSAQSAPRFDAPATPDIAGRQAQEQGQAMMRAGEVAGRIAVDMQQEANQLRVIKASNEAKEQMFNLLYDKDVGAFNQKGWNALNRPSGKDLSVEYTDRFDEVTGQIADSLGNDAQRLAFRQHADSMRTQMFGETQRHLSSEYKTFRVSEYDGTVGTAKREISLVGASGNISQLPDGTTNLDNAIARITAATKEKARLLGLSQEQADVVARKEISDAHTLAIGGAIESGKTDYAVSYFEKYKNQMDADDILSVRGNITKEMDARVGTTAAGEVLRQLAPRIQTSDAERAFNIAVGTESGGKQFSKDGTPLTSPKGAIGIAQVMPATAPEAAKMAGLEWDENRYKTDPAYNKAIGLAYFQKQLQTNGGDLAKSYAAYNAGPGALQEAIKKADRSVSLNKNDPTVPVKQWIDFLPLETRNYVAKNMKEYDAGQGQAARPTFAEIDEKLRADPRLANSPSRYKVARVEAERMFEEQTKAIKQREDESVAAAMRAVVENGGRYSDLPASVRAAIPPKEIDNVIGFAQKIAKGDDTTSPWLYNKLTSNPGQLASMSDDAFYALRRELSEADFKHFSQERAKASGKSVSGASGDLNTGAIKQTLDERLRMLQIDPSPKDDGGSDAARIGGIRRFVDQYFYAAQRESGKKFSDAEVAQHIDTLFAKNAEFRGWFSSKSGPMLGMKAGDLPGDVKDNLKAAFKRQGIDSPTDAQLMNAYWNMKVARK